MDILEFIAVWSVVSVVVGLLLGRAIYLMGDDAPPLSKPGPAGDVLPADALTDDFNSPTGASHWSCPPIQNLIPGSRGSYRRAGSRRNLS